MQETYSVGQLLGGLKAAIADAFPPQIWVSGEIRNWHPHQRTGFVFLDLVETDESGDAPTAKIDAVIPRWKLAQIAEAASKASLTLEDGVQVRVLGSLNIYEPRGNLQFELIAIDAAYTIGQLAINREKLLASLTAEGLLRRNAEMLLPPVPLRVRLVTSYESSAYHDVIDQLAGSGMAWQVAPADTSVQGSTAEMSIAHALSQVTPADADVVVLVRGGGSATDLSAFDTEGVARAIAACPVPVFSGIGHETDRTVADEVAHTAFKTPTACAQALIDRVRGFEDEMAELWRKIYGIARWGLDSSGDELRRVAADIHRAPGKTLALATEFLANAPRRLERVSSGAFARDRQRLAEVPGRLRLASRRSLGQADRMLVGSSRSLAKTAEGMFAKRKADLANCESIRSALDPANILARGWSVTRNADGQVVRSASAVSAGDILATQVADGEIASVVAENNT